MLLEFDIKPIICYNTLDIKIGVNLYIKKKGYVMILEKVDFRSYKVCKYHVPIVDNFSLDLPRGAKILSVQEQNKKACLWVLIEKATPTVKRFFRLAGTGNYIKESSDKLNFVGTFQLLDGNFVGHLFEII